MRLRDQIRTYRDELKGAAILWIVFFHARLGLGGLAYGIQQLGYAGVDVFFFLTGFGLYHSLERNADLRTYFVRRARRILPVFWPLCAIWLALVIPGLNLSTVPALQTALGNLLMFGFFAGVPRMLSWYVSALALVVFLAPCIHVFLRDAQKPRRRATLMIALAVLPGVCYAFDERLIAVSRLPVFVLGMAFAAPGKARQSAPREAAAHALCFAAGAALLAACMTRFPAALLDYGMYWYPFLLMTPPLCAGMALLFQALKRVDRVLAPLRAIGRASFEIFLLDCGMEFYAKKIVGLESPLGWLALSLGCVAAGCLCHQCFQWLQRREAAARRRPA